MAVTITIPVSDFVVAGIRTAVPILVGWLLTLGPTPDLLRTLGISNDTLINLVAFALAFAYWWLISALEHRWPTLGLLLGVPAKPTYPAVPSPPAVVHTPAHAVVPADPLPASTVTATPTT